MAWEESASIDWAREMRGIFSIAKAVAPLAAIRSTPSGSVQRGEEADQDGALAEAGRPPPRTAATTLTTASAAQGSPVVAPASSKRASGRPAFGARAGLDHDLVALLRELAHDLGDERDTALAGGRLGGDADPQGSGTVPERHRAIGEPTSRRR